MEQINFHTCPWWLLPAFDNPLRKIIHDPQRILIPYVNAGDTALDVGCGMGYFTLALARLVKGKDGAKSGRVIAADLQVQMLDGLRRRAERAGIMDSIQLVQCLPEHIGLQYPLDFALAFWMVHEVSSLESFLKEINIALKPGGCFLVVEPFVHVSRRAFENMIEQAEELGFTDEDRPQVNLSRSVLLRKSK